jgi:hypothetical protein
MLLSAGTLSVMWGDEDDNTSSPFFTPAVTHFLSPGGLTVSLLTVPSEVTNVPTLPVYGSSSPVVLTHW